MRKNTIILKLSFLSLVFSAAVSSLGQQDLGAMFEAAPVDGANYHDSPVWGSLNLDSAPWVHTAALGWIYVDPDGDPSGFFFWSQILGWVFTTASQFPESYLADGQVWILFDFSDGSGIKYFDLKNREWILRQKPGFEYFSLDLTNGQARVPSDLDGYHKTYHWSGSSFLTDTIDIGGSGLTAYNKNWSWMYGKYETFRINPTDHRFHKVRSCDLDNLWSPEDTKAKLKIPEPEVIVNVSERDDGSTEIEYMNFLTQETWNEVKQDI